MPRKRGNAKTSAEDVVSEIPSDSVPAEVPAKKGRAAKAVKPVIEDEEVLSVPEEEPKNGNATAKRGKRVKDNENGDSADNADSEVSEPAKNGDKAPAKRGRKGKAPIAKKTSEDEEPENIPEESSKVAEDETEVAQKPKRGRKAVDKKETESSAKGKKAKEVEEPSSEDAEEAEAEPEIKPSAKRGRGATKKETPPKEEDSVEKVSTKKRGNKADNEPPAKKKATKPLLNKASTDYSESDFSCNKTNASGKLWNFKISSWNVDGIRAWANKGGLSYIDHEKPDILCLQETKCSQDKLPSEVASAPGYHPYWLSGEKEGYAGVGIYTKKMAISVTYGLGDTSLDDEGRIITAEYEQFYLICTYVPNSGRGLVTLSKRLQWNEIFRKYVKGLDAKKPVIICGDMNVSHLEIDLANPKTNKKNAGFTPEEREGMTNLLGDGFVDTFRKLYPDQTAAYTFWTYMSNCRAKNVGWRLDYAIVSERLMAAVCDNVIRSQVFGSDHCPITLFLHVNGLENLSKEE